MIAAGLLILAALPAAPAPDLTLLCARFSGHDQDGDGVAELGALAPHETAGDTGSLALVLVEARLLAEGAGVLDDALRRHVHDLAAEGRRAASVVVDLPASRRHQDGLTLLALRELLRAVHAAEQADGAALEGVLLVGRFPDALLVRTCNWRRDDPFVLHAGTPDELRHEGPWLRRVPEDVAHRADVVLADLDGRWEELYVGPPTRLPTLVAAFHGGRDASIPRRGGPCLELVEGTVEYEDFFLVADGKVERLLHGEPYTSTSLLLVDDAADHECGPADRARPNPLPVPDVLVSRLDARGVALRPRTDLRDAEGLGLLDAGGRPRALAADPSGVLPRWSDVWEHDPTLERELLVRYLDRNHAYRRGEGPLAWRPASLAHDLGSGYGTVQAAAAGWSETGGPQSDVHGHPDLVRAVEWLRRPAVLRTLRAHSDPWGSVFERPDVEALERLVGGPVWSWSPREDRLVPSLRAACAGGKLDWFLLHTLWRNDALAPEPSFWLHTGCHGVSPAGALDRPFDDPAYGLRQGGESLLLLGRGLALLGRSKVFYDEPRGFAEVLAAGEPFGETWRRYFELESRASSWDRVGGDIGRKRATFWSVLGDWSLRLRGPR